MSKFLVIAGLAVLLSGCGEKGDFEKAINEHISKSKVCYSFRTMTLRSIKVFRLRSTMAIVLLDTVPVMKS